MCFYDLRTHDDTVKWAEQAETLTEGQHVYGITGRSVFLDVKEFDVINHMLPEPMHLLDGGFFKNLMGKIFKINNTQSHVPGYKRISTPPLNESLL